MAIKKNIANALILIIIIRVAFYIFYNSSDYLPFNDILFIRDLMWLDFWGLLFICSVIALLSYENRNNVKNYILLILISVFGFITIRLIFNGTPFSVNGFWGDQAFRIAYLLKLMTNSAPVDFYYKELAPFYPPLYFYLLAGLGRWLSLEAYELSKIGLSLVFLIMPFLLFYSWRPVVGKFRSVYISLAMFIVTLIGFNFAFFNPYEFIGTVLFIPWWLYFMEGYHHRLRRLFSYIIGGITGGLLFCLYPYPFFIGGLYLIIFSLVTIIRFDKIHFQKIINNWIVVSATAVFSVWYWLPAFLDVMKFGGKPGNQEWFHIGRTGINLELTDFSWLGLVLLMSIAIAVYKYKSKLNRVVVNFIIFTLGFYLLGALLNLVDHPINIAKTVTLLVYLPGVLLGLLLSNGFRSLKKNRRYFTSAILTILLVLSTISFIGLARHNQVKSARTSEVLDWNISKATKVKLTGKVVLSGEEKLTAFYPVFLFSAVNQHYSHPASRYYQRYQLISMLSHVYDPYLMNLVLSYNKYIGIDFVLPQVRENKFIFPFVLSSYPDQFKNYNISLYKTPFENSNCFEKEATSNVFRVLPLKDYYMTDIFYGCRSLKDSLYKVLSTVYIYKNLSDSGQTLFDQFYPSDVKKYDGLSGFSEEYSFDNKISIFSSAVLERGDSVTVCFGYRVNDFLFDNYKIFLHITADGEFYNFDFYPDKKTSALKPGELFYAFRTIPKLSESMSFSTGFFVGTERLGKALNGKIALK